jgi:hypothetical protein
MIALGVVSTLLVATLPIAILLLLNAHRDRRAWQIAFDIPGAIALDLVLVLLLSRVFVLDIAAWVAKGVWVAVAVAVLAHRRRSGRVPAWPAALSRSLLLRGLLLGLIGVGVSLPMSRSCAIWDRQFHIPLTTSLLGQTAPFVHVYEPWKLLFYHYGGDLYGATLQAYSFGILHSSHALSLEHDVGFFWLGVCVALTLQDAGLKKTLLAAVVYLTMLFSGPVTLFYGGKIRPGSRSLLNFICLSYRPHVPLGVLLVLPLVALPMVRLREPERDISLFELLTPLAACTAILMITDEFTVGACGLALAAVWLWRPRVFGKTRKQGLIFFAGLGFSLIAAVVLFKGTLGLGAPHYPLSFTAPRSPGFYVPSLSFSEPNGLFYFVTDLLPIIGVFLGGALLLIYSRDEQLIGTFIAYATMTVVAVLLFATLVYEDGGLQNHRFVTGPMLFGPMVAAVWLLPRTEHTSVVSSFPGLLMMLVIGLGSATSIEWLVGSDVFTGCVDAGLGGHRFYDVNCRADTGSGVSTQRTQTTYIESSVLYRYSGCRPTFLVGPVENLDGHEMKFGIARMGLDALAEMNKDPRFLEPSAAVSVVCPQGQSSDRACRLLQAAGACSPAGSLVSLCTMTPAQRRAALGKH